MLHGWLWPLRLLSGGQNANLLCNQANSHISYLKYEANTEIVWNCSTWSRIKVSRIQKHMPGKHVNSIKCLCEYYTYIYITMLNMQVIAPKGINTYSFNLPWTFHYSPLISHLYSIPSPYPNELSPWTGRFSVSRFEAPCRQCIDSEVLDETRVPGAGWWYTYPCEKYDSQLGRMTSHIWNGK